MLLKPGAGWFLRGIERGWDLRHGVIFGGSIEEKKLFQDDSFVFCRRWKEILAIGLKMIALSTLSQLIDS